MDDDQYNNSHFTYPLKIFLFLQMQLKNIVKNIEIFENKIIDY